MTTLISSHRKWLTTLYLVVAITVRPAGADESSSNSAKQLAAAVQPFVDKHTLAGAVMLVADRDKVLSVATVGYADIAAKSMMSADTLFWIASQSKPITAAALMMLMDEGKLALDDPVEKYLPGVQAIGGCRAE